MGMNKPLRTIVFNYADLFLLLACVVFFLWQPELDLAVSALFYDNEFYWNQSFIVRAIYLVFAKIHIVFLLGFIISIVVYSSRKQQAKKVASIYLLCTLLLGPGILVNSVLKDNSVGRPRPVHVEQFGGKMEYAAVFHYSGMCQKNCSFVSGHASIGFYIMAMYWITRRKAWLVGGLLLGAAVGFTRIIQGGHFFSDVIFAGWVVYFTCKFLNILFTYHLKRTGEN